MRAPLRPHVANSREASDTNRPEETIPQPATAISCTSIYSAILEGEREDNRNKEREDEEKAAAAFLISKGKKNETSTGNSVVTAVLSLLEADIEHWPAISAYEWSPTRNELLSLQFLKLYQHKAFARLRLAPLGQPVYFAPLSSTMTTEADTPAHNDALRIEADLHRYFDRLIVMAERALSSLATRATASSEEAAYLANSSPSSGVLPALTAMQHNLLGQLFLPGLQLASQKQVACPWLLEPLCSLMSPLRSLHDYVLQYALFIYLFI